MVSLIIVHYHVKKELFACLTSIRASKQKIRYEVIVVDNNEGNELASEIRKEFPWVIYHKSKKNVGYGAGNNIGANLAKGEYLFFLNPDTEIFDHTIDELILFLQKKNNKVIVAPTLLDKKGVIYPLQGAKELTPLRGIFGFSFLDKVFPNNHISREYWMKENDKNSVREVAIVPGTAFIVPITIFKQVAGFDEKLFLYFDEIDFCKRVKKLRVKLYMIPTSKVMHLWGKSTQHNKKIATIFAKSRYYYFQKHYGMLSAIMVELAARFNKSWLLAILILFMAMALRFYNISEQMIFIGDQAWFYLSARDMLLTGNIPTVGITSSHTWLHQGPLWTYVLAIIFSLSQYHPIAPGYFTVILDLFTIMLLYKVGSELFTKKVGIIAATLYAFSPLVIMHARMPYHTSPIPFFTLLLIYTLYRWMQGNNTFFPLVLFSLAVLYNFELATVSLWGILFLVLIYGFFRRKQFMTAFKDKIILTFSFLAFFLPMIPILVYDVQHGFPQTLKFAAWIGYQFLKLFGFPSVNGHVSDTSQFLPLSFGYIQRLVFLPHQSLAVGIFMIGVVIFYYYMFQKWKRKGLTAAHILLFLWITITIGSYIITRTPSEAYIPMMYPSFFLVGGVLFEVLVKTRLGVVGIGVIIILTVVNLYILLSHNYFIGISSGYGPSLADRVTAAKQIMQQANGKEYTIIGKGEGSQFRSYTMNYEYLTWWLGLEPSKKKTDNVISVEDTNDNIFIKKVYD